MALLPEIEKRASVRSFTEEPVTQEQLDAVLEAGRLAPSAKNRQAWRFVVIENPELRTRVQDAAFGQDYVGQANGQLSYPVDMGIACSFMMLQAVHEGLGTCVVTTFKEQEVKTLLTVPYSMRIVMLLLVGHPAEPTERARRMSASRIVSYDHW
jgi:nitroreductase